MDRKELEKLQNMADWMDSKFVFPGTKIRFGLDSILGFLPGIGDSVTLLSAIYLVGKAHKHGVPNHIKIRMIWNAFIDWVVGLVPLLGDILDVGIKSNQKNVELLKKHFGHL